MGGDLQGQTSQKVSTTVIGDGIEGQNNQIDDLGDHKDHTFAKCLLLNDGYGQGDILSRIFPSLYDFCSTHCFSDDQKDCHLRHTANQLINFFTRNPICRQFATSYV